MTYMTRRKKTRVYGFSGHISHLEERIARCKSKLADPSDLDDKRWLARWLKAAEIRLAEKEKSRETKIASRFRKRDSNEQTGAD